MSKSKTARKGSARRRVATRSAKGARWEQPGVCPESLHPLVAVIDERANALKRLLKKPALTPAASRELVRVITTLEQCKARVTLACGKGSPPYHVPATF
ncbi:MAG: hypothetical protein GEV06_19170 [Luteitalea sp.]|nr:hypothetical protein [Luteitalea sp.]